MQNLIDPIIFEPVCSDFPMILTFLNCAFFQLQNPQLSLQIIGNVQRPFNFIGRGFYEWFRLGNNLIDLEKSRQFEISLPADIFRYIILTLVAVHRAGVVQILSLLI